MDIKKPFDLFFRERDEEMFDEDAEVELDEKDTRTAFFTGTKLAIADIEKDVSQMTAFLDRDHVVADQLELHHVLVKRAGLCEVEGRQADMSKAVVRHGRYSVGLKFEIEGDRGVGHAAALVEAASIRRTMSGSRSRW